MVQEDQADIIGDEFPVIMTVNSFWGDNFDIKASGVSNNMYLTAITGEQTVLKEILERRLANVAEEVD